MSAVAELLPAMPTRTALRALAAAPATWYRRRALRVVRPACSRPAPPLALAAAEREQILQTLNSPRFVDVTPYTAYAQLLDEGIYLGSVRTFYRVLCAAGELRERRNQLIHRPHTMLVFCPTNNWTIGSGSTMLRECRDQRPHCNSKQPMRSSCGNGCRRSVRRSKWR